MAMWGRDRADANVVSACPRYSGPARNRSAHMTVSRGLGLMEPDRLAEEVQNSSGERSLGPFKLRLGYPSLSEDLAALKRSP